MQGFNGRKKFERIQCLWFQDVGHAQTAPETEVRRLKPAPIFRAIWAEMGSTRVPVARRQGPSAAN
jgi:hypothetical protein